MNRGTAVGDLERANVLAALTRKAEFRHTDRAALPNFWHQRRNASVRLKKLGSSSPRDHAKTFEAPPGYCGYRGSGASVAGG